MRRNVLLFVLLFAALALPTFAADITIPADSIQTVTVTVTDAHNNTVTCPTLTLTDEGESLHIGFIDGGSYGVFKLYQPDYVVGLTHVHVVCNSQTVATKSVEFTVGSPAAATITPVGTPQIR
jgi:hypothetical protein